ncbi:LAME_0G12332g1_1 [Lachancea meyersii CBS 8951]|uniref:tRNA wybutosine-synthesizing protein 2 n=1 Tax=Lachancea meyersii CBS 8951 TaxID=1266667 RepID=A0A1G4K9P6_9SACH|nr:LAME_0G12332g1_1 [Lachancea meyersii CBS 8951]
MATIELLVTDVRYLKQIKTRLEQENAFVKPIASENGHKVVKTRLAKNDEVVEELLSQYGDALCVRLSNEAGDTGEKQKDRLSRFAQIFLQNNGTPTEEIAVLLEHLPLRYSLYEPVVLFNNSVERTFLHESWKMALSKSANAGFMRQMLGELFPQYTHVATNQPIVDYDEMRRPFHIVSLEGTLFEGVIRPQVQNQPSKQDFDASVWCHVVQNGIHQVWSPVFTMFSRGNIKEKKRILDPTAYIDVEGNDAVDLYAGIGYFTLSYLKREARRVFCFELNPWSTEGLQRGVVLNQFQGQCHVFQESNEHCLERLANFQNLRVRHINLGLLPSSLQGYPWALEIAQKYGAMPVTTLHVHENIHINDITSGQFVRDTLNALHGIKPEFLYVLAHLEKVKTFAPDVWHCVLDIDVTWKT